MEGLAHADTVPRAAVPLGQLVGQYRLVRELGRGGMGAVFAAVHEQLGHEVAIKLIGKGEGKSDGPGALAQARFLREGRAAAQLEDPRIVRVHDCGTDAELGPYLVLDLVRSSSLEKTLASRRLTVPEVRRVVAEVARALATAHRHGIVHRDVKPANIFFMPATVDAEGRERPATVKLTDFGIAKLRNDRDLLNTSDGSLVGTPLFMAPEQWRGDPVSPQTDLWALGVLLHVLLAGDPPWSGTLLQVAKKVTEGTFEDLATRAPEAPQDLIELARQLLAQNPQDRPATAMDVAETCGDMTSTFAGGSTRIVTPSEGTSPKMLAFAASLVIGALAAWVVYMRAVPPHHEGAAAEARSSIASPLAPSNLPSPSVPVPTVSAAEAVTVPRAERQTAPSASVADPPKKNVATARPAPTPSAAAPAPAASVPDPHHFDELYRRPKTP